MKSAETERIFRGKSELTNRLTHEFFFAKRQVLDVLEGILSSPKGIVLETALLGSAMRHKTLSNNIANANTPGFKRSDVLFENALQEALESASGQRIGLQATHAGHLAGQRGGLLPGAQQMGTHSMRNDGNNVDIDVEMAELAKNNLYYNAVAQDLGRHFTLLRSVINGGK